MAFKLQSDKIIITPNLAALRFGGKTAYHLVYNGPGQSSVTLHVNKNYCIAELLPNISNDKE